MATPLSAASTYASVARAVTDSSALTLGKKPVEADPETSFGSVLKNALTSVVDMGHKSDAAARGAVNGKGNLVDVVTAVSETQVAIDAVVAVRDKVIQAYEDIMKMPI